MKKISFIMITLLSIISIELKSQTTTCVYDSVSGNYIITFMQDTLEQLIFYPRTKIVPSVRAWIIISNDTVKYCYQITNSHLSEQHLSDFYLPNNLTIYDVKKPEIDWRFYYSKKTKGLFWATIKLNHYTLPGEDYYEIGMPPNSSVEGFMYSSKGLPSIVDCYFQGSRLSGSDHELPGDVTDILDSLEAFPLNYVKGTTIGPILSSVPFIPLAFLDTLLSYTRQSVQLGWLKDGKDNDCDNDEKPDDGVVKNLEKRLTKAQQELTKGDTLKTSRELEKFIKKVERISKHNDIMTSEAYALLKYNAEYLLERLITLPPKPKGTLLQQIDSLKIELQNQSKKKNIGGVIFVKGLTLLIDKAKKELQKQDSSETALYIALFQLVVDETWELTQKLEEKKKKFAALYVLDEAYIALHHRAEYILEALPEQRRSVHEQRQQMMKEDSSLKEIQQELGTMKKSVE